MPHIELDRPLGYILDGDTPVPCDDIETVARFFEDASNRRVAETKLCLREHVAVLDAAQGMRPIGTEEKTVTVTVSTVFLCYDHNFRHGEKPILWETMIFGGKHDQWQRRHDCASDARAVHNAVVAWLEGKGPEPD